MNICHARMDAQGWHAARSGARRAAMRLRLASRQRASWQAPPDSRGRWPRRTALGRRVFGTGTVRACLPLRSLPCPQCNLLLVCRPACLLSPVPSLPLMHRCSYFVSCHEHVMSLRRHRGRRPPAPHKLPACCPKAPGMLMPKIKMKIKIERKIHTPSMPLRRARTTTR
jgi:hypothetical protein